MTRPSSLRRLLAVGTAAFVVGTAALLTGFVLLFATLRSEFDRDLRETAVAQHAADEIMTSVYGQLLAAYRQLQNPSAKNMQNFDSLGQIAFTRLREYLFQPMAIEPRLQVETIKELHEALEVEAHRAFDLILRGEPAAARVHIGAMEAGVTQLETEMNHFVTLRERERSEEHAARVSALRRWASVIAILLIVLSAQAILFLRAVRARVVRPLAQISDVANQLGAGDLGARVGPQAHSELAVVASNFNEMARRVQAARDEVDAQNRELSTALHDLREAQQSLVQQEKMSAVGTMLAGLAHELNNPLAGILGSAQIIEDELRGHADPAVQRTLSDVVKPLVTEAERAGTLVRNLLEFSRKSNATIEVVGVKRAIDVAAGLRSFAFAQAGKSLRVDVPGDLYVEVNAQRLEHVAMNVMTNALDAIKSGGGTSVTVRAALTEPEWMTLTFIDDGPGFREPTRVFDPFYTTKLAGAGTGLGLTVVNRFVTEAGGTIHATNVTPHGACITIRLRVVPAPPAAAAVTVNETPRASHEPVVATTPASADRSVLIVDDEPSLRSIQKRFLAKSGVRVTLAASGAEAKAIIGREHFDAVVTDIRMPGELDGIALYHWIKSAKPELAERCLFVSGDLADTLRESMLRELPERLIAKPFTRDDYVARVHAVLSRVESGR